MRIHGRAARPTIFVSDTSQWHHRPTYTEIVRRAHAAGLAGATVLRGIEGHGSSRHVHATRILSLADDLPIVIIIVDDEPRIRDFLPQVEEVVENGLVVVDGVEAYRYLHLDRGRSLAHRRPGRQRRRRRSPAG